MPASLTDGFAIEDEAPRFDRRNVAGETAIPIRPVVPVLGEEADAVDVFYDLGAVPVEFDLMAPVAALWRALDELGLHRLDELQPAPHRNA